MIFRRSGRFDGLIRTQLDLFAEDEADLLAEARTADEAWSRAGRDDAEELYGDYQLVVDAIGDALLDIRETYASALAEEAVNEYRAAFTRAATKRFPRYASLLAAAVVAFLLVLPALASTISGTNGPDTIRGTRGADRISARGGNDKVFGLAGGDVLSGGSGRDYVDGGGGSDRLSTRDGTRDTAVCGPGVDTVVADRVDAVRADCEAVLRPSLPPPPPPPPRTLVTGKYEGRTSQGESVAFEVRTGGTLSKLIFPSIRLSCEPVGGPAVSWSQDFGASVYSITTDGSFTVDESGTAVVLGTPAPYRVVVTGRLTSGIATGAVTLDVRYASGAAAYACTAPNVRWTAAAGVLNEPR